MRSPELRLLMVAALVHCWPGPARAEETTATLGEITRKDQNPIADLRKVPLEYSAKFAAGASSADVEHQLQLKPVLPLSTGEVSYLVFRAIVPFTSKPASGGAGRTTGLGDIDLQTIFVPSRARQLIWGVGPSIYFPTATDDRLGSGKWSIGPVAAAGFWAAPFHIIVLVQNVWSFAGDSARSDVNQLTLQPKLHYNLPDAWAIGSEPSITADWTAPSGQRWTVPVGAVVSKTTKIGPQAVTFQAGGYWSAARPTGAGQWDLRAQVTFQFPEEAKP
jgi:hypothetical protein